MCPDVRPSHPSLGVCILVVGDKAKQDRATSLSLLPKHFPFHCPTTDMPYFAEKDAGLEGREGLGLGNSLSWRSREFCFPQNTTK